MCIQKLLLLPEVVPKQGGCSVPWSMLILLQLLLIADIVTISGASSFTAVVALRIHWHYLNGVPTTP